MPCGKNYASAFTVVAVVIDAKAQRSVPLEHVNENARVAEQLLGDFSSPGRGLLLSGFREGVWAGSGRPKGSPTSCLPLPPPHVESR